MSNYEALAGMRLVKDETLTNLAEAVQAAEGTSDSMTPEEMAERVTEIGALMKRLVTRQITDDDMPKLFSLKDGHSNCWARENAFAYCKNLTKVVMPTGNFFQVSGGVFRNCENLAEVDTSKCVAQYWFGEAFYGTKVEYLEFADGTIQIDWACSGAKFLKTVVVKGSTLLTVGAAVYNCPALELLDFSQFTGTTIPFIDTESTTHAYAPKNYKTLVPASLIRAWKVATNWSAIKDRIVCSLGDGYTVTIPSGLEIPLGATLYINGSAVPFTAGTQYAGVHCVGLGEAGYIMTARIDGDPDLNDFVYEDKEISANTTITSVSIT